MTVQRRGQRHPLTEAEEQLIVELLRQGQATYRVAATVRRGPAVVSAVRQKHGITALKVGVRPADAPPSPVVEEAEYEECRVADPWIAPAGIAYIERPNGARWRERVAAAVALEVRGCLQAIRSVLGLDDTATSSDMEKALIADRRPAEELARLYLAALEGQ